ncbi:MAG TPA: glycoside hydrolase family 38 C-terminal domain-containing protein [Candidatus Hydrogenedentes bacterium]|nr:glycoside hydrolase family 38 C-terminal domain-containing protein [Candidatus Hydrogenedentota bacterium]
MKAFYVVGTHWDREWYEPFQEFRRWLVELVDELMGLWERDPAYGCFHLDGQTVVLEDYLEIRPERKDRLLSLIREGRLVVGPWYNLPDEWLVSGEALVRNLLRGKKICETLNIPRMHFMYTPDQFGHIAALPMLAAQFGLEAGICWRGTQDETHPAHFAWIGPDGSRVAWHKLIDKGSYAGFDFGVRRPLKESGYDFSKLPGLFDAYFTEEAARSTVPVVLMLDAVDHQRPDPRMPEILDALRKARPDIAFHWGTLEEFGRVISGHLNALPEWRGELRLPCRDANRFAQYLITHTLSSRYDVKRENDYCQGLLEYWAEPLSVLETMEGNTQPPGFLDKAWQYLLRCHPHDSICGCSIDQVHRDMHYRFAQVEQLAEGIIRRAMATVAGATAAADSWKRLAVHNPLPQDRKGVYNLEIFMPSEFGEVSKTVFLDGLATGERFNRFRLRDRQGREIPYQHVRVSRRQERKRLNELGRLDTVVGDLYEVAAEVDLPSCGYTTVTVEPCMEATRTWGTLLTGPMEADNGILRVSIGTRGELSVLHHSSGVAYEGGLQYQDQADAGDGWTWGPVLNDRDIRSYGSEVTTGIAENGPLRVTFEVRRRLRVPVELLFGEEVRRSDAGTELEIVDRVTLQRGEPLVRVRTVVHNSARDHRLRVLFPHPWQARCSFADTPFALVERPANPPEGVGTWHERWNAETAFTTFFGVAGDSGGLVVISGGGLHEYAFLNGSGSPLALTLFRAFRKTVGKPEEKDGQLQGPLEFSYALYPFGGRFNPVEAFRLAAELRVPPRAHAVREDAPDFRSLLRLECGVAVVTAIKPAEDGRGAVIRFWNPTPDTITDGFKLDRPFKEVWLCRMDETPLRVLQPGDGFVPVHIDPHGTATVKFTWD